MGVNFRRNIEGNVLRGEQRKQRIFYCFVVRSRDVKFEFFVWITSRVQSHRITRTFTVDRIARFEKCIGFSTSVSRFLAKRSTSSGNSRAEQQTRTQHE